MPKFALKEMNEINGEQDFKKLSIDDNCQFDDFEKEIKDTKRYYSELAGIYLYMERAANNASLPDTKFKDITPDGEKVKEYEFKSKHLRVYAIKGDGGKIIILGGYKNKQKRELKKFRGIKKRYLESKEP